MNLPPGPNKLHPSLLKELPEVIAKPNKNFWRSCVVSEDYRRANVVPVFKTGRRT